MFIYLKFQSNMWVRNWLYPQLQPHSREKIWVDGKKIFHVLLYVLLSTLQLVLLFYMDLVFCKDKRFPGLAVAQVGLKLSDYIELSLKLSLVSSENTIEI